MNPNDLKGKKNIDFNPVMVEASKYERDLMVLEDFNPTVICRTDRNTLQSMVLSYDLEEYKEKEGVTNKNFYYLKGCLMRVIFKKLQDLNSIVIDRQREQDLGKTSKLGSRPVPGSSLSQRRKKK